MTLLLQIFLVCIISSSKPPSPLILCDASRHCTIHCLTDQQCVGKTLICPPNQSCKIKCDATHSCLNTTIIGNQSSHLYIYTLSSYAASNTHIYCPSSDSSRCQIYGNAASHHQWHNLNLHIYAKRDHHSNYNYEFICDSSTACATDGSISLFIHLNHSHTACRLSNTTYHCIDPHHRTRNLLSSLLSTTSTSTHSDSSSSMNPFGIQLSTTQLSWLLFVAALLLISLLCVVICLLLCIWKRKRNDDKINVTAAHDTNHNDTNNDENVSFKYLVLAYQDGKKLKIPFDISTESFHAALSDEQNRIISVDIITHDEESLSQNTVVPSLHIDNEHSPIDIVMEDMMDGTVLSSPNLHSTLIKVGDNTAQKQRIIQNSMSTLNSMDLMNTIKKYKTRKDSDVTGDKSRSWCNESDSDDCESESQESEESEEGETLHLNKKKKKKDANRIHNRRLHHQSSSHPQILATNNLHKPHKNSPKRPKTAHPNSPKNTAHTFNAWKKSIHNNSSLESDVAEIPSIQLSSSAPTHPRMDKRRMMMLSHNNNNNNLTPSKKGLRRSPLTLPKPSPDKRRHLQLQPPPILTTAHNNIYQNAAAMQYQMAMHHQRHQRTLQPHHGRSNMVNERHMSEPSNAYKKNADATQIFAHVGHMAPLSLKDDATDQSIRTRSKSHPAEPHRIHSNVWDNEYAGFVMNAEVYDSPNHNHTKSKHNKRSSKARHIKIKAKNKDVNPFSKGEAVHQSKGNRLQIPMYVKSGTGQKIKHTKYYTDHTRLEAEHSITTNLSTHYTETTISDTPIPFDINPITCRPINIQYKTTTISSAFIPPPPSPQLTKTKPTHYTLSPPNSLNTLDTNTNGTGTPQRGVSQQTTSTVTTHTFDGGTKVGEAPHEDTESTLSQDTANSNANNRMRSANPSEETMTYKNNIKYASAPAPVAIENAAIHPPPFQIHIVQTAMNDATHDDDDDTLSSQTDSNSDGDDMHRFSKHYIVNSMESDKMMYIPPVPMHAAHDHDNNEVPIRNPYAMRRLKPLPDTGSIDAMSLDRQSKTNQYNYSKIRQHNNNNNKYTNEQQQQQEEEEDEEEDDESYNDEEKALNPSYGPGHNNPYLLEPKMTTNISNDSSNVSNPTSFPNRASSSTHPPTFPSMRSSTVNSNHNDNNYFSHHPLTETIHTSTISQSDDNESDNVCTWPTPTHAHMEVNSDYVQ